MNLNKVGRELKSLYEQNKDLIEHNKQLRDDLTDSEEKVRKLVNVFKRHPEVLLNIESDLDVTESKIHDKSDIVNVIPSNNYRRDKDMQDKYMKELVYVSRNNVPIPKLDKDIIDKYNQLNIEGKLPHIVETNHFDPVAVKAEVKEMLLSIPLFMQPEHQYV